MEVSNHLEQYAALLRTRQKWARRNLLVFGGVSVIGALAIIGMILLNQPNYTPSPAIVFLAAIMYTGALARVIMLATECRMLKSVLELLDVLQRAIGSNPSSNRPQIQVHE